MSSAKKHIILLYLRQSTALLLVCVVYAATLLFAPAAQAAYREELESLLNPGRAPRTTMEEPITPLPRAERQAQAEPLQASWQLHVVSPAALGPVEGASADSTSPIAAAPLPQWLEESPVWLFITLTPGEEGSYFYAPFSGLQSDADITAAGAAVLPTSIEMVRPDGTPLPDFRFYYPPGSLKKDPFSGFELPVYQQEVTVLASYPAYYAGIPMQLKLNALICTETSCTPFRKVYDLVLSTADIQTTPPDPGFMRALAAYRSAPFLNPAELAGDYAGTGAQGSPGQALEAGGAAQMPQDFADYLARLQPSFYLQGLEVSHIGRAVLFGLLAGLILNFMPCVLPVISLKIGALLGLGGWSDFKNAKAAGQGRRRFRLYALCFTLGIFVWFGLLFGVIRMAGMIWGQFFQNNSVILGLTLLLFVMALGLFGLVRLPVLHAEVSNHKSLPRQAFFGGLLATLLATPCSGPLLGGVLGWAVNQSALYLALTLASVAVGMASPFLLMAIKPELAKRLPQPGEWTKRLEIVMGFVLMGTALYLLSLLPQTKQMVVLAACLALAFLAWVWKQAKKTRCPALAGIILGVLALCALYMPFVHTQAETGWKEFDAAQLTRQLGQQNILLDFTADWCINCRAMEFATFTPQRMAAWAKSYDLTYIKVDLTTSNPEGEALLKAMGSASIPLVAIIPASEPQHPEVLRDMVTPGQLDTALKLTLGRK